MNKPVGYTDFVEFYTLEQYNDFEDELRKDLVPLYSSPPEKQTPKRHEYDPIMLGVICRSSRAWLGWSQDELANKIGKCRTVILKIEQGKSNPQLNTYSKLMSVFEENGIKITQNDKTLTLKIDGRKNDIFSS